MPLSRRGRRWLWLLSAAILLFGIAGWWVNRQLEPQRLTATVLKVAGESLQLDLRFEGTPDYALKPEPRLLIPNFSVRSADGKLFLVAKRAEISLPWSTITGDEPVITRVELEQPVLDMPGMRHWLAMRPKVPFKLPTLTKGLQIVDGTVNDDGYAIRKLALELPRLKTGEPADIGAKGTFTQEGTTLDFDAELDAMTAGLVSDFTLKATGVLQQSPKPLPFKIVSAGHYVSNDVEFTVDAPSLKFEAASPLPNLDGKARLSLAGQMRLDFDGILLNWPKAWPALPQPLAADTDKLPVVIAYLGKSDLSDPMSLTVTREPTTLQASLRIPEMRRWLAAPNGSPLPPLNGSLRTPSLVFDGIELQGVELEVSDSPVAGTKP